MRIPCRFAALLAALVLTAAAARADDNPAPRSTEKSERDRSARAALALALAQAEARPAAAVAVAPAPHAAAPTTYADGVKKAVADQRPLVVFVACKQHPVAGADVVESNTPTFGDVAGPAVVICVPQGPHLGIDSALPCPVKAAEVKAAVDRAQKNWGDGGPPRPMPAAPKPLDFQIRGGPGCLCGPDCACAAGTCPGACGVCSSATLAPVVVGYRQEYRCNGERCVLTWVPVYGQPSAPTAAAPGVVAQSPFSASPVAAASADGNDALAELNAKRAGRGLRPYLRDEGLTRAAEACAAARADRLLFGHFLPKQHGISDYSFLPAGVRCDATGCAAYPPSDGWLSCCMWDSYTYAGAAWVVGRDGRRYMHVFCRN